MRSLATGIFATLLLITSCKQEDPVPILSYPANRMNATTGSQSFTSDDLTAALTPTSIAISGSVNSGTSKASTITLNIDNYSSLATYAIDSFTRARYSDVSGTYIATSGSIAITAY